ncbi:MAG: ERCC4 domain-containing protein [Acidimicrobiia bacterium]
MEFVIARNPDDASSLPFLVRLPMGSRPVVLKVKDTWPRTAKVFCHAAAEWPDVDDLEIVERVPVVSCVRRGVAIDLVLDRARENRSQFVFTRARGREVVFWQSARTRKQARPNVAVPTARASGLRLHIVVDTRERYAWKFSAQQATTLKRALTVGDYAVEADGEVVAVVERKSVDDLVSTIVGGKLWTLLSGLSDVSHAALVVDDRYSAVFKLTRVRPASIAEQIAEAAVRYPMVPIVFAETRQLAQEWTYRFFGAAIEHRNNDAAGAARFDTLATAGPVPAPEVTTAEVRAWAIATGLDVSDRGRLRPEIWEAHRAASCSHQRLREGTPQPGVQFPLRHQLTLDDRQSPKSRTSR